MLSLLQNMLPLYKFKIYIRATHDIEFYNFPGIALRGGLGHILKTTVCVFKSIDAVCKKCVLVQTCVYANAFESLNYSDTKVMKKATHLPHPFVITPVIKNKKINAGDEFNIYLTLIGKGITYFPHFVYSLNKLGEKGINKNKGTYSILKIVNIVDNSEICDYKTLSIENNLKPFDSFENYGEIKSIKINFITPCKIMQNKKEVNNISFEFLMKTILRRIKILSIIYNDKLITENFNELIEQSKNNIIKKSNIHWVLNERYSKRQNNKMLLKGFTGYVIYEGNFKIFYPFLKIAEIVNIGKNTSFGYGALKVSVID